MDEKDEKYGEAQLASYWNFRFKEAMVHKSAYTKRWQLYLDAYNGEYFNNKSLPDYKSNLVSNYIFSVIETIRPIMLDNDPKFQALPRHPDGMDYANDLQEAFSFEWDREKMNAKLYRELIPTLVIGNSVFFTPWDRDKKEIRAIPVNAFNIFPNPLATSVDDAEYIIYASYKNETVLKRKFPHRAKDLMGGDVNYGELVHDNDRNANIDNQILVLEVWTYDYESTEEDSEGVPRQKYPHGRVITLCPELGIVLSDRKNPYMDGRLPFLVLKDYDIPGKFWGEGEVAQLLSPQQYMNELNNAIIDNAKATANMPWIIDRNSGIGQGKITSRPGLIIRKNPGTEVRREQPPNMPNYVINAVETIKADIQQVSGVFDTLKGQNEVGVYTAQGILALQEAGQSRIRLKVKILEDFLSELAKMWYYRMKQFWNEDRWVRITKSDGTYEFREFSKDVFKHEYDIKIMAGSTMPVNRGAMLDLMIRLAQTMMPDGQPIVDREAVVEYLPSEIRSAMMDRMREGDTNIQQQIEELTMMSQQIAEQLQMVKEESDQNDEDVLGVIEQLAGSLEQVNKKILQLEEEHARLEDEKKQEEERTKLREQAYNEGYSDAERLLNSENAPLELGVFEEEEEPLEADTLDETEGSEGEEGVTEDLGEGDVAELPDDILAGLEELSDDELALLLQQNPDLAQLLR